MTQTVSSTRRTDSITIRSYRPDDHSACRRLWAELAKEHRALYPGRPGTGDPTGEGRQTDLGAGFEEYLTRLDLSGMWVAHHPEDGVVGLVGLILQGRTGTIDPVVVSARRRGQGIGRALLTRVAEEARDRGLRELSISPELRNAGAIHCVFRAGYEAASAITFTLDLTGRQPHGSEGIDLHGVKFGY